MPIGANNLIAKCTQEDDPEVLSEVAREFDAAESATGTAAKADLSKTLSLAAVKARPVLLSMSRLSAL